MDLTILQEFFTSIAVSSTVGDYIKILVFFALMDFVSGIIRAYIKGEIKSRKMSNGALRKIGILIAAAVIYELDIILGVHGMFANIMKYWFIIMESISILENLQQAGVTLPNFLIKGLKVCQDTLDQKGEDVIEDVANIVDKVKK